jgi:hypothetical protein
MVLHELERHAGVEQMRSDRVPQAMAGVARVEACAIAVANETRLNLSFSERPAATSK